MKSMRLIDADELEEHIWRERLDTRERIENLVKRMPTVQPERKKAKWIRHGAKEGHIIEKYTCSECDYYFGTKTSNFCPNCGAEMEN